MERYRLFGLTVESDLPLPGAPLAPPGEADAVIVRGAVPADPPPGAAAPSPYFHAVEGTGCFRAPGVGRYLIEGGRRIVYAPEPGASEAEVRLFLLGSCIGLLLAQRGLLVMHGAAVDIAGRAVLCVGRSGAGKSTLAAAFQRRGHRVLSDDLSPVDGEGKVAPGLARLKLWRDSATALGIGTAGLPPVRTGIDKYFLPLARAPETGPVQVDRIYVLRTENRRGGAPLRGVRGAAALTLLARHTYRLAFLDAMGLGAAHLVQVSRLANQARLATLARPAGRFDPDAMIDQILADVGN